MSNKFDEMATEPMTQEFFCEQCGLKSTVNTTTHEDAWSVAMKIDNAHHKLSPNCENPVARIRVRA